MAISVFRSGADEKTMGVKFILRLITRDRGLESRSDEGCRRAHVILADNLVVFLYDIDNSVLWAEVST